MNLFILICSALFGNLIKNVTNYPYLNTESSGNDERFIDSYSILENWKNENEILFRIRKYYYYMAILNFLESPTISEKDKLERIEFEKGEPIHKIYDLYAGGLLNDWNMEDWDM